MSPRLGNGPLPKEQRDAIAARQRALNAEHVANPDRVADELVREFFELLAKSPHSMNTLCAAVRMNRNTIKGWRHGRDPRLTLLQFALNEIGYRLAIVPIEKGGAS